MALAIKNINIRRKVLESTDGCINLAHIHQGEWLYCQEHLRILRKEISHETFLGCQEIILRNLVHLRIYRRQESATIRTGVHENIFVLQALGTPFQRPAIGDPRTTDKQYSFRSRLVSYYDCRLTDQTWCPILHAWLPTKSCTAAHIIPYSFPPHIFRLIFNLQEDDASTGYQFEPDLVPQNELYISRTLEQAFDRGQFIFVPYQNHHGCFDYRVHLLDDALKTNHALLIEGTSTKWSDIDGRELDFRNNKRPNRYFVYFHILLTILRQCVYQPPGWAYRLSEFLDIQQPVVLDSHSRLIESLFAKFTNIITDEVVYREVARTLPLDPVRLPAELSEGEIRSVIEESDDFVADIVGDMFSESGSLNGAFT